MSKITARKRRGLKTKYSINESNRLRLVIFRSNANIFSQIIEKSSKGDIVLASSSTLDKELKSKLSGTKSNQAAEVGKLLAERAKKKNIDKVAFDRNGFKYHGRVKALADAAREAGLDF